MRLRLVSCAALVTAAVVGLANADAWAQAPYRVDRSARSLTTATPRPAPASPHKRLLTWSQRHQARQLTGKRQLSRQATAATTTTTSADRFAVTSYDRMQGGAPYHGDFGNAWQGFVAESDTITSLGVTVGTPGYTSDGHTVAIRLCTDPTCSSILAEAQPQIVNYQNTSVDIGDVGVTPGTTYYVVWYQPTAWNGQRWVTYWWSGGSSIEQSDQMQAIVQGYNRGPAVDRTAVTSYNQMSPGAPYHAYFTSAYQSFTAASNTITSLGVTVGTPNYSADGHTIKIRLCGDPNCNANYGETQPQVVNYGNTQGDIGDVSVTPGATYYVVWYQPATWNGQTWVTYWWAGGPSISQSDQMQAIVQGYNRTTPVPPTYHVKGTAGLGLNKRTGPGLAYPVTGNIGEASAIQISCQTRSASVVGGSSIWDELSDSSYISDFYTDTPIYNGFTPGLPQCTAPPPPPSVNTSYSVYGTNGLGLKQRTGPSMVYPAVGALPEGSVVAIACQYRSNNYVNGSSIWDKLGDGTWVADGYVNTPAVNQFTAGLPQCTGVPIPPSYEYPYSQSYGRPGRTTYGTNPTAVASDPVNTLTGAWWTQDTDLKLSGIGVPFQLERSYTSANTARGPMGQGWTFNYNVSLAFNSSGDVTVIADQGAQLPFQFMTSGLFVPPPGVDATLRKVQTGYELIKHDQTHYLFDTNGQLQSILDRNGQGLHMTNSANGALSAITDSAGRNISFGYDSTSNLLTSVTLPDGRSVQYRYTNGLLTTVTDAAGGTTTYNYDSAGRATSVVDANGHTRVQNSYGPDGRVTQQTDALGRVSTFAWNAATETATMTDARGGTWKDVYSNNVLTARIDPNGNKTAYTYDGDLNLIAVTDPRGNASGANADDYTTHYSYDAFGNRISETDPLGHTKSWVYDGLNDLTSATDARGNTTTYTYEAAGNRTSMTQPGGITTTYGRDASGTGLLASQTDPLGKTTHYGYDSAGDRTSQTTPLGETTTMTYDSSGRLTSRVDPRGNVLGHNPDTYRTRFAYDALDHLTTTTDPLGHAATTTYDAVGNKTSSADPNGRVTRYGYDTADHLTSVTSPSGAVTAYAYDDTGNIIKRTDAKGHVTSYGYDAANELTSQTDALGRKTAYDYDAAGNLITTVDAKGVTTRNSYDALNRRTGWTYSDSTPTVGFSYDENGNRIGMTDGTGSETRSYDALNRVQSIFGPAGNYLYSYDDAGHVTARNYVGSGTMSYTYDADGRLASGVSNSQVTTATYGYDPAGNETAIRLANGYVETKTYDAASRITRVRTAKGTPTLTDYRYSRDAAGNPTKVVGTDGTTLLSYDSNERLAKVCYTSPCSTTANTYIRWAYDAVGNRTSETRSATPTKYSYDAADEMLSAVTGTSGMSYKYDADGNQTQAGTRTFAYDATHHIVSTSAPSGAGSATTTMTYNGDGNRIQSTTATDVTVYGWDANNQLPQLATEHDGQGTLLRQYLYGNELLAEIEASSTYYLTGDQLGSITGVTGADGTPLNRYSYEPFGTTRSTTSLSSSGAPALEPLRFNGQYADSFAMYDLRAREYDPSTGRFTAVDPVRADVRDPFVSTYVYAKDRPTTLTDPSGELVWILIGATAGGISYGIGCYFEHNCSWTGFAVSVLFGAVGGIFGAPALPSLGEGLLFAFGQGVGEYVSPPAAAAAGYSSPGTPANHHK